MQSNSTTPNEQGIWHFSDYITRCNKCGREILPSESFLYFRAHNKLACESCVAAASSRTMAEVA